MKALLQRVTEASVSVADEVVGSIGPGLVVFVCAEEGDDDEVVAFFARKIANMRIFADAEGKMNRSLLDMAGAALVVSQFTLAARWRKGNRPGFSGAADPEPGRRLYADFCRHLGDLGVPVATGRFGAAMAVRLTNDGPVTIWMDSADPT